MKKRLFVLATAATILTGIGGFASAGTGQEGLKFDASIDTSSMCATMEGAIKKKISLKVEKLSDQPVSGQIVMRYPDQIDPSAKKTKKIKFALEKTKNAQLESDIELPEGLKPGQYTFPIDVYIGDKKYLDMDMLVEKSVKWEYSGYYPGGVNDSFDKAFSPETNNASDSNWKIFPYKAITSDGFFRFDMLFPGLNFATAYAKTTVYSDKEVCARLMLGSDDAIKVWQNGKLVAF